MLRKDGTEPTSLVKFDSSHELTAVGTDDFGGADISLTRQEPRSATTLNRHTVRRIGLLTAAVALLLTVAFANVEFVQTAGYKGSLGPVVIGVVMNTANTAVEFIEVVTSFYDDAGNYLGNGTGFAGLEIMLPGEISPFTVLGFNVGDGFSRYDYQVQWRETTQQPIRDLAIVNSRLSDGFVGQQISGQVRNDTGSAVCFVEIMAVGYTADERLAAVGTGFASLDVLQPGQTSPFDILITEAIGSIETYRLVVQARPSR